MGCDRELFDDVASAFLETVLDARIEMASTILSNLEDQLKRLREFLGAMGIKQAA